MSDISELEVVRGLNYWTGKFDELSAEHQRQLRVLDTSSMIHDFKVTEAQADRQAQRQVELRRDMNSGVGNELRTGQKFGRQRLALALEPETSTVVASLLFADNVSSARPSIIGAIERELKLRAGARISNRYHLLGWRAVLPELMPDDPQVMSSRFSVADALVLLSFIGKDYRQPIRSYPWLGPGKFGEHWWTATLRGFGMHHLDPSEDTPVKPFDNGGHIFQQVWGVPSIAEAEGIIFRNKSKLAGARWPLAQRNIVDAIEPY